MRTVLTLGRPLAATLVFGLLLLGGIGAVTSAWADLTTAIEERDAQADALGHSVDAARHAKRTGAEASQPFILAESDTQAAARLDELVRAAALDAGCALVSSQAEAKAPDPAAPEEAGIGTRLEDQAVIEGQNDQLLTMLAALETGAPVVMVKAFSLVPADDPGGVPAAPRLRLIVTLAAYRHAAGS